MADPIISDAESIALLLTAREREVLALIAEGLTVPEIARRLHRSRKTIETHRLSLGRKLGVDNRVKLARLAIQAGVAPLDVRGDETPPSRETEVQAAPPIATRTVELLEASSDGLYILDAQGCIVLANAALCKLLGRPRDQVVSHRTTEFVHAPQRDWYRRQLEARANQQHVALELDLNRPDGDVVRVQISAEALYDHETKYIGSMGRLRELERWNPDQRDTPTPN
jgi:PAS domain S-box-containing protein